MSFPLAFDLHHIKIEIYNTQPENPKKSCQILCKSNLMKTIFR